MCVIKLPDNHGHKFEVVSKRILEKRKLNLNTVLLRQNFVAGCNERQGTEFFERFPVKCKGSERSAHAVGFRRNADAVFHINAMRRAQNDDTAVSAAHDRFGAIGGGRTGIGIPCMRLYQCDCFFAGLAGVGTFHPFGNLPVQNPGVCIEP